MSLLGFRRRDSARGAAEAVGCPSARDAATPAAFEIACPSCGLRTATPTLLCPRCREPLPLSCSGDCRSCAEGQPTCRPTLSAGPRRGG